MIVSPSRRWLLRHCGAPFTGRLPTVDAPGRSAIEGTAAHKALELHALGDVTTACRVAARLRPGVQAAREKIDALRANHTLRPEQVYALNLKTGESVARAITDRNYPNEPDTIFGTADLVAEDRDAQAFVVDYKTGKPSPATEDQMNLLAVMAGVDRAEVWYLGDGLRIEAVKLKPRSQVLDELRADVAMIETAWPSPGPWCEAGWCPARGECSAYRESR